MKKNARATHELEEGVALGLAAAAGLAAAREWATPRVDAAYDWAKPRWEKGIETAGPALQDTVRKATEGLAGGIAVVTPKIQDGIDKVGPRISHIIDDTTPKIQGTLDKAAPALNSAKDKVVDDYLPALSTKLGEAADTASRSLASATVPPAVEKAVIKITGDKKAVKKAQKRLAAATHQASKDLKKSGSRKKGKGWLIFGIIATAVIAAVAAWRASKPVEDPWKTPASIKPTPAPVKATPAPVSSEKTREAKEVVTSIKEAADRAAASQGETKVDAKSDDKAKAANDAKEDAKANTAGAAKTVADKAKDVTETAKHAAKPSDEPKA